jgi:hypothetical protein
MLNNVVGYQTIKKIFAKNELKNKLTYENNPERALANFSN